MALTDQAIKRATKSKLATQIMICVITTCFDDNVDDQHGNIVISGFNIRKEKINTVRTYSTYCLKPQIDRCCVVRNSIEKVIQGELGTEEDE